MTMHSEHSQLKIRHEGIWNNLNCQTHPSSKEPPTHFWLVQQPTSSPLNCNT